MAVITITLADLQLTSTSETVTAVFGETGAGGQVFYRNTSDDLHYLAINTAVDTALVAGILITPKVVLNGTGLLLVGGSIIIGGTLVQSEQYVLSSTAGAIFAHSELLSTQFVSSIGVATDAATLRYELNNTGVVVP